MTEQTKAPRSALTLKFDAEQAMSIWLWAKVQEVDLDDVDGLSAMIAEMIDQQIEGFRNPPPFKFENQPGQPTPTQPEKGGKDVSGA